MVSKLAVMQDSPSFMHRRRRDIGKIAQCADFPRMDDLEIFLPVADLLGPFQSPGKTVELQARAGRLKIIPPDLSVPHGEEKLSARIIVFGFHDVPDTEADIGKGRVSAKSHCGQD
jgi:hypothetical protein